MLGFDGIETTEEIICRLETTHMIRKGQVEEIQCALSEVKIVIIVLSRSYG